MAQIKHALILAAGFGKRLLPITEHTPKAMMQVGGEVLLDRLIAQLKQAGIEKIYINTHHLSEIIESHVRNNHPEISLLHEPEILETGASIRSLMQSTGLEEVFAVNCDSWFASQDPFSAFLQNWYVKDADAMILLTKAADCIGDFAVNDALISRPEETQNRTHIWSGAYILRHHLFDGFEHLPNFSSRDVIFRALQEQNHKILGFLYDELWIDIGNITALEKANLIAAR